MAGAAAEKSTAGQHSKCSRQHSSHYQVRQPPGLTVAAAAVATERVLGSASDECSALVVRRLCVCDWEDSLARETAVFAVFLTAKGCPSR